MNKRRAIRLIVALAITMAYIFGMVSAFAEGLLPSVSETVGIAMPSLGEALQRYPDSETENEDGSVTELYTNVSESDFNTFSVYLEQQEAQLADYKAEKGVLTAEIRAKGASFSLQYDSKAGEAKVTYLSGTFDEWNKNAKTRFDVAQKLLEEGKTVEAYSEITAIPQLKVFKPFNNQMKNDDHFAVAMVKAREMRLMPYKTVGNIVSFGTYPQTKAGLDRTPIEWIVLDYDEVNNKALLISKYGLDAVQYNNKDTDITWENCTLRFWLNNEFLNNAFSKAEQAWILTTVVDNSKDQGNSGWSTDGGNKTQDQIFALSVAEAKRYFNISYEHNVDSCVAPTAYAIAKGTFTSDDYQTKDGDLAGNWWLRSPGHFQNHAACVSVRGELFGFQLYHGNVIDGNYCVRPALWLNLEDDIF